jgi:hypothetical protein
VANGILTKGGEKNMFSIIVAENEDLRTVAAELIQQQYQKIPSKKRRFLSQETEEIFSPTEKSLDFDELLGILRREGTTTFLAFKEDVAVATVSTVEDKPGAKLPMEDLYHEEVGFLRKRYDGKLAEIVRLAGTNLTPGVVASFFASILRLGIKKDLKAFVCMADPMSTLYRKLIFFEKIGAIKYYPAVHNYAEGKFLDIDRLLAETLGGSANTASRFTRKIVSKALAA